jgi:peptide/nickel transport system substrate-binding protein
MLSKIAWLLVIVPILLVGCSSPTAIPTSAPSVPTSAPAPPTSAPVSAATPSAAPQVSRVKELKVGQPANPVDITCWDWTAVNELDIAQHIVEPLWRFDRDGKLQGVVLDSWEMKSPTDWTLHIRKGMKFQDPKYGELKAEDVVASLTLCFKPDGRALPKQSGVIAKMKLDAVDDYTVHVTLPEPGNAGLPNDWIYTEISSKKYLDEVGKGFNLKPMGTGPFKFVEWVPNVRIVADRNPDYWGTAPSVDRITWRILPDPFTRKSEFLTGGLDILPMMDASWLADVKANSSLRVEPVLSARYMMVILPAKQPPFNDKRVRQALNYAINKDEIVKQLFVGVGAVLPTGVVNPVLPEGRPNNVVYPYDPNKAKQLLDQARADGAKIGKINLYATNDRYTLDKELGEAVSGYWRAVGLDVTYTPQSNTVLLPKSQALQMVDPHLVGFGNTKLRADYPFTIWLQTRDNPRSRGSEYAVAPKEWDPMIDQLVSMASGSPESTKLARQLDDLFTDYAPWAFVTNYIDLYGVSNAVDWKPYFYEARYFIDAKPKQ